MLCRKKKADFLPFSSFAVGLLLLSPIHLPSFLYLALTPHTLTLAHIPSVLTAQTTKVSTMAIRCRCRQGSYSSFSGASIKRLLFTLPFFLSCTRSQSYYVPTTAVGSYSVFIEDKAMYIASGQPFYAAQTFSLDLNSTWDTTSPKFTRLSNLGAPVDFLVPNTLLNDQSWLVISNNRSYRYNIQANTWSSVATLTNLFPISEWILSGAVETSGSIPDRSFLWYVLQKTNMLAH